MYQIFLQPDMFLFVRIKCSVNKVFWEHLKNIILSCNQDIICICEEWLKIGRI